MFNKEIMDALGITQEDVQTEEGFYAACEKVKNSGYQVDGQSVLPVVLQCNLWINSSLDGIVSWNFGAVRWMKTAITDIWNSARDIKTA